MLTQLGGLYRGLLSGRTRADHCQIIGVCHKSPCSPSRPYAIGFLKDGECSSAVLFSFRSFIDTVVVLGGSCNWKRRPNFMLVTALLDSCGLCNVFVGATHRGLPLHLA